jgi:hypothetical protein
MVRSLEVQIVSRVAFDNITPASVICQNAVATQATSEAALSEAEQHLQLSMHFCNLIYQSTKITSLYQAWRLCLPADIGQLLPLRNVRFQYSKSLINVVACTVACMVYITCPDNSSLHKNC